MIRLILLIIALGASPAHAGTIYTCKNAHGQTSYQQDPCPNNAKVTHVRTFTPEADGGSTWGAQVATRQSSSGTLQVQQTQVQSGVPGSIQPAAAAYECSANGRAWVQQQPCPASTSRNVATHVNGILTTTGQPVEGTAFMRVDTPVQSKKLNQTELCRQMRDGAATSERKKDSSSADAAYQYNKMRDHTDGC